MLPHLNTCFALASGLLASLPTVSLVPGLQSGGWQAGPGNSWCQIKGCTREPDLPDVAHAVNAGTACKRCDLLAHHKARTPATPAARGLHLILQIWRLRLGPGVLLNSRQASEMVFSVCTILAYGHDPCPAAADWASIPAEKKVKNMNSHVYSRGGKIRKAWEEIKSETPVESER